MAAGSFSIPNNTCTDCTEAKQQPIVQIDWIRSDVHITTTIMNSEQRGQTLISITMYLTNTPFLVSFPPSQWVSLMDHVKAALFWSLSYPPSLPHLPEAVANMSQSAVWTNMQTRTDKALPTAYSPWNSLVITYKIISCLSQDSLFCASLMKLWVVVLSTVKVYCTRGLGARKSLLVRFIQPAWNYENC